jgi:hypothetical protein
MIVALFHERKAYIYFRIRNQWIREPLRYVFCYFPCPPLSHQLKHNFFLLRRTITPACRHFWTLVAPYALVEIKQQQPIRHMFQLPFIKVSHATTSYPINRHTDTLGFLIYLDACRLSKIWQTKPKSIPARENKNKKEEEKPNTVMYHISF